MSNGTIIALDNYQPFLDILMQNAIKMGVDERIIPKHQSMLEMDFKNNTFDVIWSEGALYFMGFQKGLKRCHQLLKKKGYLTVTEAVFLLSTIPKPLQKFWNEGYPDIKDVRSNITLIQNEGFELFAHFTLPKSSWIDTYYSPMEKRINDLKKKYYNNKIAFKYLKSVKKKLEYIIDNPQVLERFRDNMPEVKNIEDNARELEEIYSNLINKKMA